MNQDILCSRNERPYLFAAFLFIFAIYLCSAPRTVVLEDDGLFILAAYFNGIAHPPGYPLYTLLSHSMTYLPIGSIAYRVHLLSAFFGSLACTLLIYLLRLLIPGRIYAYTAGFALGFSQIFWSQSIIAEVYTLNAFLLLWLIILAYRYEAKPGSGSKRLIMFMGLLYGLSLSNHWPLLLLSSPALIIIMYPKWQRLFREAIFAFPFLLIGLLPYIWMIYRSQMNPEISFYGPLESWKDFWFVVSRKGYAELDQSLSAGWWDKLQFCGFVLRESTKQFGPLGAIISIIGFVYQWKRWPYRVGISLTTLYICNTFVLIGLLGFDYELLHRNIFRVYPIIAYSVMAVWLGLGLFVSTEWVIEKCGERVSDGLLKTGISVLLVGMILILNANVNYRANDNWTRKYAHAIFDTIESDAIIFTDGDLDMYPLGYYNRIENVRNDVTLYNGKGVGFSNRLFFPLRESLETRKKNIADFIAQQNRPVYYTSGLPHDYRVIKYGLYQKINPDPSTKLEQSIARSEIVDYFKELLAAGEPIDAWEVMHYRLLVTDYCILSLSLLRGANNVDPVSKELTDWIKIICSGYQGLLEKIDYFLSLKEINMKYVQGLINEADMKKDQAVIKSELAKLEFLKAKFFHFNNQIEKEKFYYMESIKKWSHPDNPAYQELEQMDNN